MLPYSEEEKKNERIGLVISLGIHVAMLLLFFFVFVWQPPNPPNPEYGIELNFGVDAAGFGQNQTTGPASDADSKDDAKKGEEAIKPTPTTPETVEEPLKEAVNSTPPIQSSPIESPHVVEESKSTASPKKTEAPNKNSEVNGARGREGTGDKAAKNNNGDRPGAVGDQGNPQGSLDAKALYGKPGSGGGSTLEMTGWRWESAPNQKDLSNEEGKIVFEIKVDETGEIISVRTLEKTVSPTVEKFYKQQVERLSFVKTRDNVTPASESTGKITVIINSK